MNAWVLLCINKQVECIFFQYYSVIALIYKHKDDVQQSTNRF